MKTTDPRELLDDTFSYREAREAGLSDARIYGLRDAGAILALGGGVYRWSDAPPADFDLIEIAERVPRATLCLETALARHELIDSIPGAIDISIPRGKTRPALKAPCRLHQFDLQTFDLGRETLDVDARTPLGIYSAERSLVDIVRIRHLQGSDIAWEALRRWLRQPGASPAQLIEARQALRRRGAGNPQGTGSPAVSAPTRASTAGRAYLDLRKLARENRRPVDELLQLYVLEAFLARLADSRFTERLVLKAGPAGRL